MKYKRVLLKLSGESLAKENNTGIDFEKLLNIAEIIKECTEKGVINNEI